MEELENTQPQQLLMPIVSLNRWKCWKIANHRRKTLHQAAHRAALQVQFCWGGGGGFFNVFTFQSQMINGMVKTQKEFPFALLKCDSFPNMTATIFK